MTLPFAGERRGLLEAAACVDRLTGISALDAAGMEGWPVYPTRTGFVGYEIRYYRLEQTDQRAYLH